MAALNNRIGQGDARSTLWQVHSLALRTSWVQVAIQLIGRIRGFLGPFLTPRGELPPTAHARPSRPQWRRRHSPLR
jgi:hypothetical protein